MFTNLRPHVTGALPLWSSTPLFFLSPFISHSILPVKGKQMALRAPNCKMIQNVSQIRLFKSSKCPDRRENITFVFHPWVFLHFSSFMSINVKPPALLPRWATLNLSTVLNLLFTSQGRIKKIMQKDTEVGRIATAVPVILCILANTQCWMLVESHL